MDLLDGLRQRAGEALGPARDHRALTRNPPEPIGNCAAALTAAERYLEVARAGVLGSVVQHQGGAPDAALLERGQLAVHGYAWVATYVTALRALLGWATRRWN